MKRILVLLCLSLFLFSCATEVESTEEDKAYYENVTFESNEIEEQGSIAVYLPGGYEDSTDEYSVVYFLNGHQGNQHEFLRAMSAFNEYNQDNLDDQIIVVGVNGYNNYWGSFFVNSPITGNWENFFLKEVIQRVESEYRVKVGKESRGIAGYSMGGSGSLNIALKHPELFGAVYALSPGVISDIEELGVAVSDWRRYTDLFRQGYTQAFAGELLEYPEFNDTQEDNALINKWLIGYGSYEDRLNEYLAGDNRINRIMIAYGVNDIYRWIPRGSQWLYDIMDDLELDVDLYTHQGGHVFNSTVVGDSMLEFFRDNLE